MTSTPNAFSAGRAPCALPSLHFNLFLARSPFGAETEFATMKLSP